MSECVVFEDSSSGVRAGVAARARAVIGIRSSLDAATLSQLGATISLADWQGLTPQLLRSLTTDTQADAAKAREAASGAAVPPTSLRVASLPLLAACAVTSLAPRRCVRECVLCSGDEAIPTAATRAVGGALLPFVAAANAYLATRTASPSAPGTSGTSAALSSSAQEHVLVLGLVGSTLVQAQAIARDGHALRPWARRLLLACLGGSTGACITASAWPWAAPLLDRRLS